MRRVPRKPFTRASPGETAMVHGRPDIAAGALCTLCPITSSANSFASPSGRP